MAKLPKLAVAAALGLTSAGFALLLGLAPFARTVELKTYDWRLRATADPARARDDIVLVHIDDESLQRLAPLVGRWPWPRLVHAQLLNFLARARPKAVVYDVQFTEPDIRRFTVQDEEWTGAESDDELARATGAVGSVVHLADVVGAAAAAGAEVAPLPGALPLQEVGEVRRGVLAPIAPVVANSQAVAHNLLVLDDDGPVRRVVPLVHVGPVTLPTPGVAAAMAARGLSPADVRLDERGLWLGDVVAPLVESVVPSWDGQQHSARRLLVAYPGVHQDGSPTYRTYSFYTLFYAEEQLLADQAPVVSPSAFDGKIVFVGTTAAGLHDVFTVPLAGQMPGAEVHASVADSLLSGRFLHRVPGWAGALLVVLAGLLASFLTVLLGPWPGVAAVLLAAGALTGHSLWRFGQGEWWPLTTPLVALATASFAGVGYHYVVEGREKRRVKRLFSRYVSRDVYEQLLRNPAGARLGGERRQMTVLFSDIRGFTSVSERGQPEAVVAQLNEYFSRMVPIVFANRGTIDKFVGDMIMALFGAPLDDPDHADHAVETALAMSAALAALNRDWRTRGLPALDIGVGIATGEMVAGNLGSEAIMSYTVIGDQVNLGARLESLNKDFGTRILVSDSTRQALKGRYDIRALGQVVVKGKTVPVQIHAVVPPDAVAVALGADEAQTTRSQEAAGLVEQE